MSTVAQSVVNLSASQRAAVETIEREMNAAGIPPAVIAAAVVNAWAESRLNPLVVANEPKGGQSVGLFQLYDYGLGHGLTVQQRQDPVLNTRVVIAAYQKLGKPIATAAARGAGIPELTAMWTKYIENPSSSAEKGAERAAYAARLFPSGLSASLWAVGTPSPLAPVSDHSGLLWAAGAATAVLIVAALWRRGSL